MDSRQQFEEWALSRGANPVRDSESYENVEDAYAWDIWQASRESLVVALPDPFWPGYVEEDEPGLCISTDLFTIDQIAQVLTGYGIRTK